MRENRNLRRSCLLLLATLLVPTAGCGFLAQLMYVVKGNPVEAAYSGLEGKRVAVVCVSTTGTYGASTIPETLARNVEALLARQVEDIHVIDQNEVVDWIDNNDWDHVDYKDVGRGVDAEMVVAIDLASFLADSSRTMLYQGQANYAIKVFDMTNGGMLVHKRRNPDFVFPRGQPWNGNDGRRFRRLFLTVLAQEISRDFYDYEMGADVAMQAAHIDD